MLQYTWSGRTIKTNAQANQLFNMMDILSPTIGGFDTETTGLNIGIDKPFLFQGGFLKPGKTEGYTFLVDLEKQPILARAVIQKWHEYAAKFDIYFGHNVKFDMHMLHNVGLDYLGDNLSDTMFYIRYAHDAIQDAEGGPPLALKDYTTRYIDPCAKDHDHLIQAERGAIAKDLNAKLKARLAKMKLGARSYTLGVLDTLFADALFNISKDVPEDAKIAYVSWLHSDVPDDVRWQVSGLVEKDMIPYTRVKRDTLYQYAHADIVYTLETYLKTRDALTARGNMPAVLLENSCIRPLYEMEQVGFKADKAYLHQARIDMREYIRSRREMMFTMAGREFTIGQHAVIKEILKTRFNLTLVSTGSEVLNLILADLIQSDDNPEALAFVEILQEMRTLEKWYSAYIIRFLNNLKRSDRLYTTIHQVGAVSGRVTSDFQQFPKKAITTYDGRELFHPRKIIQPSGGDYDAIVFLDYSQIELRIQAVYTILVGHPDLNLCRAYMPYRCSHRQLGIFDYANAEHLSRWNEEWYRVEDGTLWTPTDLHGATTTAATGLQPGDAGFKEARGNIGKRVNFASQYGARRKRFRTMFPRASEEEVDSISEAYYNTFPGAKSYHEYCYRSANEQAFTTNLCGVRYYGASGHKLINLLIQGSCAFYLKQKIHELYIYAKEHNIKSRFQMNIHDELSWERHVSETEVFFSFQRIMQIWDGLPVPIVAEMEVTKTNWAEKKGVHDDNELHAYLGH